MNTPRTPNMGITQVNSSDGLVNNWTTSVVVSAALFGRTPASRASPNQMASTAPSTS